MCGSYIKYKLIGKDFKSFCDAFLRMLTTPTLTLNSTMVYTSVFTGIFCSSNTNVIISLDKYPRITLLFNHSFYSVLRFLLAARSSYFEEQFDSRWENLNTVPVNNKLVSATCTMQLLRNITIFLLNSFNTHPL
jgi:hypothetical protein